MSRRDADPGWLTLLAIRCAARVFVVGDGLIVSPTIRTAMQIIYDTAEEAIGRRNLERPAP